MFRGGGMIVGKKKEDINIMMLMPGWGKIKLVLFHWPGRLGDKKAQKQFILLINIVW
jgi:hypothetical protein